MKKLLTILFCLTCYKIQAQLTKNDSLVLSMEVHKPVFGVPNITDTSTEESEGYIVFYTLKNDSLITVSKKAKRINYYQNGNELFAGGPPPNADGTVYDVLELHQITIRNLIKSEIYIDDKLFAGSSYTFIPNSDITK